MNIEQIKTRIQTLQMLREVFEKASITDVLEPQEIVNALSKAAADLITSAENELTMEEKRAETSARIKPEF